MYKYISALDTKNDGLVDSSLSTIIQLKGTSSDTIDDVLADNVESLVDRFIKVSGEKLNIRSSSRQKFFSL